MDNTKIFSPEILHHVEKHKMISIKAGTAPHRFLEIWSVLVDHQVFIRSWALKKGWYETFLKEGVGEIKIRESIIPVKAKMVDDTAMIHRVSNAYHTKYNSFMDRSYTNDMVSPASEATTLELMPN
jgi:hypothetical protein